MHKKIRNLTFKDLITFQDEHFTIINKPPFLSSLEDRNDPTNLLVLSRQEIPEAQVCHRLDKETSGTIVVANHNEAYKHFASILEKREVKKVYHAVIDGLHRFENFEADEPIYTTSSKSRVDFKLGKPSLTLIETLELFKKNTLIKCFPVTGRMHQIRVHLAHHEAPISGDPAYGGKRLFLSELKKNFNHKKWEEEKPMINRVALHSFSIAFKSIDGQVIEVESPYPKDFQVLLKQLKKYN